MVNLREKIAIDSEMYRSFYAISFDRPDNLKLLLDAGANPNIHGPVGETPIMNSVVHNAFDLALTLLKRGADIGATDNMGDSVAHLVQRKKLTTRNALLRVITGIEAGSRGEGVNLPVPNPPSPWEQWRQQQKKQ